MDYFEYFNANRGAARQGAGTVPVKNEAPTRVRVLRPLLLHGERQEAGAVLTVPRWMADSMVREAMRAEFVQ